MRKNGFTLIELLAVIVILGVLMVILLPNIIDIIGNSRNKVYKEYEKTLVETTKKYMVENVQMLPTEIGLPRKIKLTELQSKEFISELKNPKDQSNNCVGYGEVEQTSEGDYEYASYIKCGNDYITNGYTDTLRLSYGGSDKDVFKKITNVSDGYVVAGSSASNDSNLTGLNKGGYDAIIVKYDLSGNIVWKKNFGGSNDDEFESMIAVSDGFIAAGYSYSSDNDVSGLNKGSADAIIIKYDLNGNVVWKKSFGGSNSDKYFKIINISTGFMAVGESGSNDQDLLSLNKGSWDAIVVKYDLSGNVVWKKTFGGTGWDTYYAIANQTDGYVAVGSGGAATGDLSGLASNGSIIVKYDLNGNIVWKKTYGSGSIYNYFRGVVNTSDNGVIAVGSSDSTTGDLAGLNKGDEDATIVKYDSSGNIIWKKNFGGSGYDWFEAIIPISGGYITVGNSSSTNDNLTGLNKGSNDAIIARYDSSGNLLWNLNYGGSDDDYFNNIVEVNNNFVAVGKSWSNDGNMTNLLNGWYDGILFTID